MSVIAIVGCMDDESSIPIRGGGKTGTAVRICRGEYDLGKNILSNCHINFELNKDGEPIPGERVHYRTAQQLLDMFFNQEIPKDTMIFFDELSFYLNSLGVDPEVVIAFVNGLVAQSRKLHTDLVHTEQRFNDIPRRLRPHCDRVLIPVKIHYAIINGKIHYGDVCFKDFSCIYNHIIEVYSEKPFRPDPIFRFYPERVGKYYDTDEIIYDTLTIPTKRTKKPSSKKLGARG